ncbi:sensor histidine kinase [Candidatus Solirubrobacter pratensis]|uniref:sensor histidine kinase n=1 Tax=Candidatus Solirubrobacter pratensis TaxID=1298857 RepID=UPI00042A5363|nr:histidine kinase [Candidatus Solirubrobacter pratensis]
MTRVIAARTLALVVGIAVLGWPNQAERLPVGGRATLILGTLLGWGFVGVGSYAWQRRPESRTGALMVLTGLTMLATGMQFSDTALLYTIGLATDSLILGPLAHLVLAFPSGRLEGRAARIGVGLIYAAGVLQIPVIMVSDDQSCATCPRNLLLLVRSDVLAGVFGTLQALLLLAGVIVAVTVLVRRRLRASRVRRRGLEPVVGLGAVILVLAIVQAVVRETALGGAVQNAFIATFALLPWAFLAGLVRTRFFRASTVGRLIQRLSLDPGALQDSLRTALDDPRLTVAYWLPELGAYVERDGREPETAGRVTTEISHCGRRVGALVHDPSVCEAPELLDEAAAAAALAIENGRLEVELRARLEALRASRARIVEAGDAERRRLTRDLHDGAQQRLVSLALELKLARDRFATDPDLSLRLVDSALANARAAVEELRDLAAGIHSAVLSQRGLDAALETLATRASLPVELESRIEERLPLPVETAAYFVVAEALTNVAKYAGATYAAVSARVEGTTAVVEVRDDGRGGADAASGSGLRGLEDRVGALDGTLRVDSPPGAGTRVRATIPLPAQEREHG